MTRNRSTGSSSRGGGRARYWNGEYVSYWKARVAEANRCGVGVSAVVSGDVRSSADSVYVSTLELARIRNSDRVLEVGCGFGRSLPVLSHCAQEVVAIDISEEMIKLARSTCPARNVSFNVCESERLPFASACFDVVVCFAAFDAMHQKEALAEMSRVARVGARITLTGKNDTYYDDDAAALDAEAGARAKGHPNFFTDLAALSANLDSFGLSIDSERYYSRRGDFSKGVVCQRRPDRFYEYALVLQKIGAQSIPDELIIARPVSRTFERLGPGR